MPHHQHPSLSHAAGTAIDSRPRSDSNPLGPLEQGLIDLFVRLAEILGFPKSMGEIYGLLFASAPPLAFQDIVDRLRISKGSTSQGLRMLRALGAVRSIYIAGDRRDYFVPETELRALLSGILRERVTPHLENGTARIRMLSDLSRDASVSCDPAKAAILRKRIEKLHTWHKKGRAIVPIVSKLFG